MPQQFHEPIMSIESLPSVDATPCVETLPDASKEDLIQEDTLQKAFASPAGIVLPETTKAQMALYGITDIEGYEAVKAEMEQYGYWTTRRVRLMSRFMGGSSGFMALYALFIFLYAMPHQIFPSLWLTIGILFLPCLVMFLPLFGSKNSFRMADKLFPLFGLRAVGFLTDMLSLSGVKQGAMDTLTRLLPNLQASDAVLLTKSQRNRLCKELERHGERGWFRKREARFAVAILKAFEQVGDADALPVVKALSDASYDVAPAIVRSAARDCLPFLEARIAEQESKNTLLRASDIASSGQNVLLRPAEEAAPEAPRQLLRASIVEIPKSTV